MSEGQQQELEYYPCRREQVAGVIERGNFVPEPDIVNLAQQAERHQSYDGTQDHFPALQGVLKRAEEGVHADDAYSRQQHDQRQDTLRSLAVEGKQEYVRSPEGDKEQRKEERERPKVPFRCPYPQDRVVLER